MNLQNCQINDYKILDLQFLISMDQCNADILMNTKDIFTMSGHAVFQYGQYYDCIQSQGYNYNLVLLGAGGVNAGFYGGFCLPKSCTTQVIKPQINFALAQIGFPYNVYDIYDNIQYYQPPFTWVFYLTVIILTLLIGMTLYATLFKPKMKLVKAVSLRETLKIFKTKDSDLNIFNGVRAIAMMWVVFGHYYFNTVTNISNALSISTIFQKPFLLLVEAGLLSVDVFFFLGGFFLSFVFMREKSKSLMKYPLAILQRVLRIWPAYVLTMMIYYSMFMHLGQGPRWPAYEPVVNICSNMWRSIFFLENFINNGQEMCLDWGWYLQVDFQIFCVCIILLFMYKHLNKIAVYVTAAVLTIGSWTFTLYYTQKHDQKLVVQLAGLMNYRDFYLDVYIKPYARWTPYFMGLFLGIAYFQHQECLKNKTSNKVSQVFSNLKQKFERKKIIRILFQWSGIAIMAFFTFITRTLQTGHQWPQIWHSIFGCFQKPFFIVGMLMVIFPTILGCKGSFFKTLLDNTLFNFLAKISFCTYLIHLIVITQYTNSRTYDYYYSIPNAFPLYLGCLVVSCFFGFLMTIFIEIPCSVWQKQFMNFVMNGMKEKSEVRRDLITDGEGINKTVQSYSQLQEKK